MNWSSTAGKSALIKMLMREHGVTKRKAEKAVNAVFDCMVRALCLGEEVELPIGWIHTARPPATRKKRKLQRFKNVQTKKTFIKRLTHPDKIIRFRANPELIERGPFPPPPPSSELVHQAEELAELLQIGISGCDGREVAAWRRRRESGLAVGAVTDVGPGTTRVHPFHQPPTYRSPDVLGSWIRTFGLSHCFFRVCPGWPWGDSVATPGRRFDDG